MRRALTRRGRRAKFKNDFRSITVRSLALANALYVLWRSVRCHGGAQQDEADAAVRYVEPNYILNSSQVLPTDPRFAEQWGCTTPARTARGRRRRRHARGVGASSGNDSVLVAVIEHGVDYNHEDLAANMWTNPGEVAAKYRR
jgi:hypothetical protein